VHKEDHIVAVYKCHLSEKVGAVCVQTLQVQLHRAATAKSKSAHAAAPNLNNIVYVSKSPLHILFYGKRNCYTMTPTALNQQRDHAVVRGGEVHQIACGSC
jgi:hypothetical protein